MASDTWVHRFYNRIGERLELGRTPAPPRPNRSLVVVPVGAVSRLTRDAIAEKHVFVLIAEVEPDRVWQRVLQNQRGAVLVRALRRRSDPFVCRFAIPDRG